MKAKFRLFLTAILLCLVLTATTAYAGDSEQKVNLAIGNFVNQTGDKELEWLTVAYPDFLRKDLSVSPLINLLTEKKAKELAGKQKSFLLEGRIIKDPKGLKIEASLLDLVSQKANNKFLLVGSKEEVINLEKDLAVQVISSFLAPLEKKISKEEEEKLREIPSQTLEAISNYYKLYGHLPEAERKLKEAQLLDNLLSQLVEVGMEYQTGSLEMTKTELKVPYSFRVKTDFVRKFIDTLQPFSLQEDYQYGFVIENSLLGDPKKIYLCKEAQDKSLVYRKKLKLIINLKDEQGEILKNIEVRPLLAPPINTFGKLFSSVEFTKGEYIFSGLTEDILSRLKEAEIKLVN